MPLSFSSKELSWEEQAQYVYDNLVFSNDRIVSGIFYNWGNYRYDAYLYERARKYATVLFTSFTGEAVLCSMGEGRWNVKQL